MTDEKLPCGSEESLIALTAILYDFDPAVNSFSIDEYPHFLYVEGVQDSFRKELDKAACI